MKNIKGAVFTILFSVLGIVPLGAQNRGKIYGKVTSADNGTVDLATVHIKETRIGVNTDNTGKYSLLVPLGEHTVMVTAIGYEPVEMVIKLSAGEHRELNFALKPQVVEIEKLEIVSSGVERVNKSVYNAIAIDAKSLHNSSVDLAHALISVPGVKLRESGGVGSDMKFSLDGFSGRHVKFFIDGVPMDGIGSSFSINNIPINIADRIEVYKGVVPVEFGADALGGVVNIVTNKRRHSFIDASYSYGSFNTHRSYVNAGYTGDKGFMVELNAFQNYSDNNYYMYTVVKDFDGQIFDDDNIEKVRRFHDTYHNEAVIGKIGFVGTNWADRMVLAVNYSQSHKDIQNGVQQDIVFGEKFQTASSLTPSFEYSKRNLFLPGLDVNFTVNYIENKSRNVDTSAYLFNWRGESKYNNGKLGEQQYQDSEFRNSSWNGTFNAGYRIGRGHSVMLNHVMEAFDRKTLSTAGSLSGAATSAGYDKKSRKNITGFSYRYAHEGKWNVSAFGKYYDQWSEGPLNTSTTGGFTFEMSEKNISTFGYGVGATYFLEKFQLKGSYEKARRLPTINEMFGDEDLATGDMSLRPEHSDNYNLNISYENKFGLHGLYIAVGGLYRDTKDFIQRNDKTASGNLKYESHANFGKVKTKGINFEFQYNYSTWLSAGGSLTYQDMRSYERNYMTSQSTTTYKQRMPNNPYFFTNFHVSFFMHDLGGRGNLLTVTYDNLYIESFPFKWPQHGAAEDKQWVPSQFSHNISIMYSIKNGRYNFAIECHNITNERLYDNYNLQKAGRAIYGKFRYFFGK